MRIEDESRKIIPVGLNKEMRLMMKTIYDKLSIRGRVAYAIMCFENYVNFKKMCQKGLDKMNSILSRPF